jgi:membrane protein
VAAASLGETFLRRPHGAAAPPSDARTLFSRGVPPSEWRDVAWCSLRQFMNDKIPAVAAGVTFYVLLALFPAISAFVSLYGLVSDVSDAAREIRSLSEILPGGAVTLIGDELTRLTETNHGALGVAFAVSLAVSIWSANAGMKALIDGLNGAYEAKETRGFFGVTLLTLVLTVGTILLAVVWLSVVVVAPQAIPGGAAIAGWLQWTLVLVSVVLSLQILYWIGPSRRLVAWRWITPGSVAAGLGWLATSALFSWYVANFGHYNRTYGSLGAIVGFLTWVWLSLMVVLLGAELNREIERRSAPARRPTPTD